ncbi:glycosyltransferase family 2 protein [Mycolicibacterium thermoresistibile]
MTAPPMRRLEPVTSADYEVVIVTYHSGEELAELLSAARRDQRIVVVDNSSGVDGTRDIVAGFRYGRWLDGGGSGFAKAANRGARTSTAEFLIFANPDCRPTPQIWDALIDDLRHDPALGLVGVGALDGSDRFELGIGGWEPTLRRTAAYICALHRIFPDTGVFARPRKNEAVQLDWLGAPCLAIRRDLFVTLGGFDERYFVYNDDMELGRTLRAAGWKQRLRTDLHIPHQGAGSGGDGTAMFQQRGASMAAYLHHHNGYGTAAAMRLMLAVGALPRAFAALLTGRPAGARQQLAYLAGLAFRRSPYQD